MFAYKTHCRAKGWTKPCTPNTSELKFPTLGQLSCVDLNTVHRVLLCCSQNHHFSTCRPTGISYNPVKLHGNRHQQSHSLSWGCAHLSLTAGFCCQQHWTRHAGAAIPLPLVLIKHPEPRILTRQKGVWLKMKRFVVFNWTQMAPDNINFSRLNSLMKASWNVLQSVPPFSVKMSSLHHCTSTSLL